VQPAQQVQLAQLVQLVLPVQLARVVLLVLLVRLVLWIAKTILSSRFFRREIKSSLVSRSRLTFLLHWSLVTK
jgi:hypothetical protein